MASFDQTVEWAQKVSHSGNRSRVSGTFLEDPGLTGLNDFGNSGGSWMILYIIGGIIVILLIIWWLVAVWSNSKSANPSNSIIDDMNDPAYVEPADAGQLLMEDVNNHPSETPDSDPSTQPDPSAQPDSLAQPDPSAQPDSWTHSVPSTDGTQVGTETVPASQVVDQ